MPGHNELGPGTTGNLAFFTDGASMLHSCMFSWIQTGLSHTLSKELKYRGFTMQARRREQMRLQRIDEQQQEEEAEREFRVCCCDSLILHHSA